MGCELSSSGPLQKRVERGLERGFDPLLHSDSCVVTSYGRMGTWSADVSSGDSAGGACAADSSVGDMLDLTDILSLHLYKRHELDWQRELAKVKFVDPPLIEVDGLYVLVSAV